MGKTDTIKKRTICIYAPTIEQKEKWEEIAKQNNTSLSKFFIKSMEDSLEESTGEIKTKEEISKENQDLRKEISELQREYKQVSVLRDNLEREIRKYRAEPFLTPDEGGIRQFDRELLDILRKAVGANGKHRFIDNDEILSRLNISFQETEAIQSISNQLSLFEQYNLVQSSTKGWRWKV